MGSGAAGSDPIIFNLDPKKGDYEKDLHRTGLDTDVGMFKIYLSTIPVDIENVPQDSPFKPFDSKTKDRLAGTKKKKHYKSSRNVPELWKTITIPVIERRYPISVKTSNREHSVINNKLAAFAFLLLPGLYFMYRFLSTFDATLLKTG